MLETVMFDIGNLSMGFSNVVIGSNATSERNHAVVIGCDATSYHENTVVIGSNAKSNRNNSVSIQDTEIYNGTLSLADENLILYGNNEDEHKKCNLCNFPMNTGVGWQRDEETKLIMCFDCIFDSLLKIKAKESWDAKQKTNKCVCTLKLENKISELERKIEILYKQI